MFRKTFITIRLTTTFANPDWFRSLTCHEDITNQGSNGWFSSGSKLNNLLKATTVGMANKAKKAASNFAKDINETVQASLALYNTEKVKKLGFRPQIVFIFAEAAVLHVRNCCGDE